MSNIQINVIGLFTENDEILDIVDVAKVFVVKERIINITNNIEPNKSLQNLSFYQLKKDYSSLNKYNKKIKYLTIHGFN